MERLTLKDPHAKTAASTVVKALHVLDVLTALNDQNPDGASVSEISKHSAESPSNVCKYLAAFQQAGLVDQDSVTERYYIGVAALRLGSTVLKRINIRDICSPFLKKLAAQTGETIHLVIRDGLRVVYIDKVESSKTIRMHSQIGSRTPMYCTGVGKALLAYSPDSLTEAVIAEGLVAMTENTLTSRDTLLEEIKLIRERGYAIDNGEHEPDVRCVAAPLFDHSERAIASISVSAPKWRMPADRIQDTGELLRQTSAEISRQLGLGLGNRIT